MIAPYRPVCAVPFLFSLSTRTIRKEGWCFTAPNTAYPARALAQIPHLRDFGYAETLGAIELESLDFRKKLSILPLFLTTKKMGSVRVSVEKDNQNRFHP